MSIGKMKFLAITITATTLVISILAIKPIVSDFNELPHPSAISSVDAAPSSTLSPSPNDKRVLPRDSDNLGKFYNKKGTSICPPWNSFCTNEEIETFDVWACSVDIMLNVDLGKERDGSNCQSFILKNKQCFNLPASLAGKVKYMRRPPTPWGVDMGGLK
jgi:hypothetical protein